MSVQAGQTTGGRVPVHVLGVRAPELDGMGGRWMVAGRDDATEGTKEWRQPTEANFLADVFEVTASPDGLQSG
jgi:hypothetical protein